MSEYGHTDKGQTKDNMLPNIGFDISFKCHIFCYVVLGTVQFHFLVRVGFVSDLFLLNAFGQLNIGNVTVHPMYQTVYTHIKTPLVYQNFISFL